MTTTQKFHCGILGASGDCNEHHSFNTRCSRLAQYQILSTQKETQWTTIVKIEGWNKLTSTKSDFEVIICGSLPNLPFCLSQPLGRLLRSFGKKISGSKSSNPYIRTVFSISEYINASIRADPERHVKTWKLYNQITLDEEAQHIYYSSVYNYKAQKLDSGIPSEDTLVRTSDTRFVLRNP